MTKIHINQHGNCEALVFKKLPKVTTKVLKTNCKVKEMNQFSETPEQESLLNELITSGWPDMGDSKDYLLVFSGTSITREQFEARDGWIVWRGGDECPVKNGEIIDAKDADGTVHTRRVMGECNDIDPLFWSDSSCHENRIVMYRLHKPSKTLPQGHPHAELMAQYAEDAKATDKPWELWEWSLKRRPDEWSAMRQEMGFEVRHNYRRKPKTKSVGRLQLDVGVNTEVLKMITDKFNELQGQIDNTKQNLCVAISEESLQEAIDNTVSNIVHYAPSDVALLALNEHLVKLLAKQREMLGIVDE